MITTIETIPNPYWMYCGEPMHVTRFVCDGQRYLTGSNFEDSMALDKMRSEKGYVKPTAEILDQLRNSASKDKNACLVTSQSS